MISVIEEQSGYNGCRFQKLGLCMRTCCTDDDDDKYRDLGLVSSYDQWGLTSGNRLITNTF